MTAPFLVLLVALSVGVPQTSADLEREARVIDTMLMSPCCYGQTVSVHPSAAAQEVKADVRRRLAAGQTRQQILNAYVAQYGKRILAEPPAEGFGLLLYAMPLAIFVASIGLITVLIRRLTRRGPITASSAASDTRSDLDERLDDELRDLD